MGSQITSAELKLEMWLFSQQCLVLNIKRKWLYNTYTIRENYKNALIFF